MFTDAIFLSLVRKVSLCDMCVQLIQTVPCVHSGGNEFYSHFGWSKRLAITETIACMHQYILYQRLNQKYTIGNDLCHKRFAPTMCHCCSCVRFLGQLHVLHYLIIGVHIQWQLWNCQPPVWIFSQEYSILLGDQHSLSFSNTLSNVDRLPERSSLEL